MKKPIKTFDQFEVVKVPFPFTDSRKVKMRPALILSAAKPFNAKVGKSIMAMITTKKSDKFAWPMDIEIEDLKSAGLPAPSIIRFKLFTLEHRIVRGLLGVLSKDDQAKVVNYLKQVFLPSSS